MGVEVVPCWYLSPLSSAQPTRSIPWRFPTEIVCSFAFNRVSNGSAILLAHSSLPNRLIETRDLGRFQLNRGAASTNTNANTGGQFLELGTRMVLCRASIGGDNSDEWHGGQAEEMAFGCHLSDSDWENENCGQAVQKFGGSWNASQRLQRDEETAKNASAGKPEDAFSSGETGSLAGSDGLGRSLGVGRPISQRYEDARTASNDRNSAPPRRSRESMGSQRKDLLHTRGQAAGVEMPMSLRLLKRKQGHGKAISRVKQKDSMKETLIGVGDSFRTAFSSMVFMIRTLQNHTLYMRQLLFYEDLQELVSMVHKEMHMSFLWLFQQVFSCTPKLMVLVMILLADFTVYSMGNNVALAGTPKSPSSLVSVLSGGLDSLNQVVDRSAGGIQIRLQDFAGLSSPRLNDEFEPLHVHIGGAGNGGGKTIKVAGGANGDAWSGAGGEGESRAMYSEDEIMAAYFSSLATPVSSQEDGNGQTPRQGTLGVGDLPIFGNKSDGGTSTRAERLLHLWKAALEELRSRPGDSQHNFALDQETMHRLVSPVTAYPEPDNYICYDRTDLNYQHAISMDPGNPLLLANYAQFLYVVRHDHNRAEELFHRAMKADPVDGEVIGRFASFLWLARGDLVAAEKAYRAAVAADPSNPFHSGSYAHFLWNSGEQEITCSIGPTT